MSQKYLDAIAKLTMGTSATASIIAEEGQVTLRKCVKYRKRTRKLNRVIEQSKTEFEQLHNFKSDNVGHVTSPLALISQIQRSGGSLLSQLFDGHPEIHPHPQELKLGYKKKYVWPRIDLNDNPERWFRILFEDIVIRHGKDGFKKGKKARKSFPFVFNPYLQKRLFIEYIGSMQPLTVRTVFDAYMTSYFGAWLNNQNHMGRKKFVTAFTPRLSTKQENMDLFFDIYPDGFLISVMRDPKNWFPSASRHYPKRYGEITKALDQWNESTRSMVRNKKKYGDRVCIISFEDLIQRTESVMRYLARFLDIRFDDILLTPTYNKIPIKSNTSFKREDPGIMSSVLDRYKTLSSEKLKIIEGMTGEALNKVLSLVAQIP